MGRAGKVFGSFSKFPFSSTISSYFYVLVPSHSRLFSSLILASSHSLLRPKSQTIIYSPPLPCLSLLSLLRIRFRRYVMSKVPLPPSQNCYSMFIFSVSSVHPLCIADMFVVQ